MQENIAGLLCYAGGWITGLIFLHKDKRPFVRFHAAQSTVVFGALSIIYLILSGGFPPTLMRLISLLITALWIFLMFKAYKGERFEIPFVKTVAEPLAAFIDKHFSESAGMSPGAPGPPPERFNASKGAVTIQIVNQIGRWNEDDATRALGAPTERGAPTVDEAGNSTFINTYSYKEPSGRMNEIQMVFDTRSKLLSGVSVMPWRVFLSEVKPFLGQNFKFSEMTSGWRTYDFTETRVGVCVDQDELIVRLIFYAGADHTPVFSPSASWPARLP